MVLVDNTLFEVDEVAKASITTWETGRPASVTITLKSGSQFSFTGYWGLAVWDLLAARVGLNIGRWLDANGKAILDQKYPNEKNDPAPAEKLEGDDIFT